MERGAQSRRSPTRTESKLNGPGNIGRQYSRGLASEPVTRVRLVGGDHERHTRGVCMLDRERARRPGQALAVRRPASQPPAVGRAVDDDPS